MTYTLYLPIPSTKALAMGLLCCHKKLNNCLYYCIVSCTYTFLKITLFLLHFYGLLEYEEVKVKIATQELYVSKQ